MRIQLNKVYCLTRKYLRQKGREKTLTDKIDYFLLLDGCMQLSTAGIIVLQDCIGVMESKMEDLIKSGLSQC